MQKSEKPFARTPIVALGTMTFGAQTSAADADRMLRMFLDEGHSWVDTAFMYTDGRSETILGRAAQGARAREGLPGDEGVSGQARRGEAARPDARLGARAIGDEPAPAADGLRGPLLSSRARQPHAAGDDAGDVPGPGARGEDARDRPEQLRVVAGGGGRAALRAERLAAAGRLPGHVQRRHAQRRARVHPGVPAFRAAVRRVQPARRRPADRQARRPQRDPVRRPILRRVLPRPVLEARVFRRGRRAAARRRARAASRRRTRRSAGCSTIPGPTACCSARARSPICARTSRPAAKGPLPPPFVQAFDEVWERTKPVAQRYFRD